MDEEQWMTKTQEHKHTEKNTGQWSKISTVLKNGHKQKNAAWIFWATAENRASTTQQHYTQAHSKHSKRSYALFYALRIAAQQRHATNSV
jgi:hypothetical protein